MLQAKLHIIALFSRLWDKGVMKDVMYCCVILHNMMVNEKRPLVKLKEHGRAAAREVRVGEDVKTCFARVTETRNPMPGTVAAMYATQAYMNLVTEYMKTRRLMFNKICSEMREE